MTSAAPGASADAIQYHYSIGNEFYRLWLDPTITYSGALWEEGDTLEAAQFRKLDYHLTQARVQSGARVFDIGCGWGSGLRRMVEKYDVGQAVGLTLSQAQADYIASCHLPRTEVRVETWLDHAPAQPYDAIISIGAPAPPMKPQQLGRIAVGLPRHRIELDAIKGGGGLDRHVALPHVLSHGLGRTFQRLAVAASTAGADPHRVARLENRGQFAVGLIGLPASAHADVDRVAAGLAATIEAPGTTMGAVDLGRDGERRACPQNGFDPQAAA